MIKQFGDYLKLDTKNTSIVILADKNPKLVYYGAKICDCDNYDFTGIKLTQQFSSADDVDNLPYLISSAGDGHNRENMIQIVTANGISSLRLALNGVEIVDNKPVLVGLPSSYGGAKTVVLKYFDNALNVGLEQYFTIFDNSDVFATSVKLINKTNADIRIKRLMSLQLDLPDGDYSLTTLEGASLRERIPTTRKMNGGTYVSASYSGLSSNSRNPFVALENSSSNKYSVQANLLYSGNHKEMVDFSPLGGVRLLTGINDYLLDYPVKANEEFYSPEAIFVLAEDNRSASYAMRDFVDKHIIPVSLRRVERPIVVNTWETFLFNFNEQKLSALCDKAVDLGIEMLVLDDGWFGGRDDDTSSLGDWFENTKKLGCSLEEFGDKIRNKGLDFGIWVEPEMINKNSELYRAHPDWAMTIDGVEPIEIRTQLVLDITKKEVRDYIVDKISSIIVRSKVSYVKWDCNRTIQEIKSSGTLYHDFVLGVYDLLSRITKKFPKLIIESCASGGNRFDLGMLCFTPQIWASDDTDARERTFIQEGTLFAYPQLTMGTHVGHIPSWHTFNGTSYDNAFSVASIGALGYEFNLCELNDEQSELVRQQIKFYKKWRSVLQFGLITVNEYTWERGISSYTVVDEKGENAVATVILTSRKMNYNYPKAYFKGLVPDYTYKVSFRSQAELDNAVEFTATGSALMHVGVYLGNMFTDKAVAENFNSVQTRMVTFEKI